MSQAALLPGLLLTLLGLPLAAAAIVSRAGRRGTDAARKAAIWFASLHLIMTVVFVAYGAAAIDRQNGSSVRFEPLGATSWAMLPLSSSHPETAVQFFIGFDGLNLPLVALASLMVFLAVLVSWESVGERAGGFYTWLFLLQAASLGAFLSFDLLLFYIFFELTLIPAFFLIGSWGVGASRRDAARKFFLYTLLGSLFTLVGLIGIAIVNPTPLDTAGQRVRAGTNLALMPRAGAVTFSIPDLMENVRVWDDAHERATKFDTLPDLKVKTALGAQHNRRTTMMWLFFALMAGLAVKVPIVPFHTWLPGAYSEAPLAVTMYLAAVLAKLGTFGILRIVIPLAPEPSVTYGLTIFGTLGAAGIIYAALCAFAQRDLKLLAAYSSVSHLGFLVLGLFALTPESLSGASLHMVNHGLTAGAMFALLAYLANRYHTLDLNQFGGLWARHREFTFFFMVIALGSVGLPGQNNFVSEMLMLAGLFDPRNVASTGVGLAVAAAAGVFLSAWYMMTAIRRVFFGPVREPAFNGDIKPMTGRECATFSILIAFCLALGLCPQPVLETMKSDVNRVVNAVEAARQRLEAPGNHR